MRDDVFPDFAQATEARRRDLPVSIALMLLVGGIAAAVLGSSLAVVWAGSIMALLIADMEIYRRLDGHTRAIDGRIKAALLGWNVGISSVFATLPIVLWIDGSPAASAAALALWLVGVVRPFGAGVSGGLIFASAGAAPAALSILFAPSLIALTSAQAADWDAAIIATLGGGALAILIVRALWGAASAQAAAQHLAVAHRNNDALRALIMGERRAVLLDRDANILAATFEADISSIWPRAQWREAMESLAAGERIYREGWEARAWRNQNGEIIGAALLEREAGAINLAQRPQAAPIETLARRA